MKSLHCDVDAWKAIQPNVEIFFNPDEEQQPQQNKQQLPVPVPVYCRPLMEKEPGMKVSQSKMVEQAQALSNRALLLFLNEGHWNSV